MASRASMALVAAALALTLAACERGPKKWSIAEVGKEPVAESFATCEGLAAEVRKKRMTEDYSFGKGFFVFSGRVAAAPSGDRETGVKIVVSDPGFETKVRGNDIWIPTLCIARLIGSLEVAQAAQDMRQGETVNLKCRLNGYSPKDGLSNEEIHCGSCILQ